MNLGAISLLPVIVMFVLIFTTKRTLLSITAATLVGSVLIGGVNFASVWLEKVQAAFMAGTLGYLFLLLALFGILIALIDKSGAALEFANWVSKYANTRRKALVLAYIIGWLLFVDDYLHNMALGTAMRRICDQHKIPRTLLGLLVNGSAATVCVMIPISTWGVFYSGFFADNGVTVNGSGLSAYLQVMPHLFYAIIMLLILFLVAIGIFPLIGAVKKDNQLALESGVVCRAECSLTDADIRDAGADGDEASKKANPLRFLLPMIVIIALTIITKDVMVACMGAIAVMIVIMLVARMKLTEIFDAAFEGASSMVSICMIIAVALTLVEINTATGMPDFVVGFLTPLLSGAAFLFPAIVFAFIAIYSFFVGGCWDGSMIFLPIVLPIANAIGVNPILVCAALVSASACSSSWYVASDAMLLTSAATEVKPFYLMKAILPYALISIVGSVICFLVCGFLGI